MPKKIDAAKKRERNKICEDGIEIRTLDRGREYSVRVMLPPDDTHKKWHWSKTRKVKGNLNDARIAGRAYKEELCASASDAPLTLGEFLDRHHESRKALGKVSSRTLEREEIDIQRIKRYIGDVLLSDLRSHTIEKAYTSMYQDGASKATLHKVDLILRKVLKKAVSAGIIQRNPCDAVDSVAKPKPDPDKKKQRRISKEQAISFMKELDAEPTTGKIAAVRLALATGMRLGEVLGLFWGDIDFENKTLSIRRQFGKDKKLRDPKTEKSKRTISIDDGTIAFLEKWKDEQKQQLEKVGKSQGNKTPVCSNQLGSHIDPDHFSRWRRSFYVKKGLAYYENEETWIDSRGIQRTRHSGYVGPDFHALRHAQATLLVAGGVDPKTVQERLGHEKISTTLEIYAEAVEENDKKAADYIGSLFAA